MKSINNFIIDILNNPIKFHNGEKRVKPGKVGVVISTGRAPTIASACLPPIGSELNNHI